MLDLHCAEETITIHSMALETVSEYKKRLKNIGIREIGAGYFSHVYAHPKQSDVVVKLVAKQDPRYIRYAKRCMKVDNRWMPKVLGITNATFITKRKKGPPTAKRQIVFLERLRKAKIREIKAAVKSILQGVDVDHDYYVTFDDFDRQTWRDIWKQSPCKETRQFAEIMYRYCPEDIHNDNVMMRGDQLVFTDPVASL